MSVGGPFRPVSCGQVAPGGSGCGADGCCSSLGREELGKNINADEAAAMGAVYQAAALSKAFKVKPFVVRDAAVFPIQVALRRVWARGLSWGGCSRGLLAAFSPGGCGWRTAAAEETGPRCGGARLPQEPSAQKPPLSSAYLSPAFTRGSAAGRCGAW